MPRDWKGGNASTFKTIGASNHCDEERADMDYYATEPAATEWLCRLETFGRWILEPSCGEGHMSEVLKAHGYEVVSRDLADRGYGEVADFLSADNRYWPGDIVTNPPYAFAQEFVEKALSIIDDGCKVAMFLKLTFLEGKRRAALFSSAPPHPRVGQPLAVEVRQERRLPALPRLGHLLRLVRMGEGLHRPSRNPMVQLTAA